MVLDTSRASRALASVRLSESAHLVGHHGEATALFAGAGRLDGGVQREQIGLVGDVAHHLGDLADTGGLLLKRHHDLDRTALAARVVLHRSDDGVDLGADLGQHSLQRVRAAAGLIGLGAGMGKHLTQAGDGGQRLLSGASNLLGGGGDLVQRPAEFVGGRGGLRNTARQFLRGGGQSFGGLLLPGTLALFSAAAGDEDPGGRWRSHGRRGVVTAGEV